MATPPVPPPAKEPTYRVVPPRRIPELTKGGPLSVGLLIQSSLSQKQTRQPIVFSLTDLVRRLRQNDEAFVMSFSKGLEFEEDLTSNDKALESAMDAISPAQGAAIYDAVTFAAGHLNRIARNRNRVLIVISGEGDRNSGVSPLELSSELNVSGVRIYCIGLDVYSQNDQARLQQLAGYTGGRAFFLSGPEQLRSALQTISNDLGIAY
jgi:VWFA-related protein